MYTYQDLKFDWNHDKQGLLLVVGIWGMLFWLILPCRLIVMAVKGTMYAYNRYGKEWFILTITNFIASGICISIGLPTLYKWIVYGTGC